ncbi:hypothetical protein DCCM_2254 [Desulfocucumis palustris]|uniref:Uncharacterized protein n=1 Tax=Desulfocucumis palustris TaxID=1898651 RepID=A0A2L2XA61_9FIRM|nr:hypothetical protein [Desulfocucumis palustris]GBF33157.1 hypothetical protein DCCM_2254 [Desulfocucumis palustris]
MSCYLRHLGPVLDRAGIELKDKKIRKSVDLSIREIVGVKEGHCPEVWKAVKEWLKDPALEQKLITELAGRKP